MAIQNRYNLIDESWIPICGAGQISLYELFSKNDHCSLGGNPLQKISLLKFLLAIAQAACTPICDREWESMGFEGMAEKCLAYLNKWHDKFWLYGENPFLQMPKIDSAKTTSFGSVLPEVATGNTPILTEYHVEKPLTDSNKALLLISLMGFAFGGKKTDNSVILTENYQGKFNEKGKVSTGKAGPFLGYLGYMHNFLGGQTLLETIWFNLLTKEQINELKYFTSGVGTPPWEKMPEGEDCDTARSLKNSLMGRLVPLSRFCLFDNDGLHYSEGIIYPTHKEGGVDPSVAINLSGKEPKAIWVDPEKRPWRHLTALLSIVFLSDTKSSFDCVQIRRGLPRAKKHAKFIGLWSGGIRVSSNAGEQYISGMDGFVESDLILDESWLGNFWFEQLKVEMDELDKLSGVLRKKIIAYFGKKKEGDKQVDAAIHLFWQLCEQEFQNLVQACAETCELEKVRKKIAESIYKVYDIFCPKETSRQIDAWAKCRPNLKEYLSKIN